MRKLPRRLLPDRIVQRVPRASEAGRNQYGEAMPSGTSDGATLSALVVPADSERIDEQTGVRAEADFEIYLRAGVDVEADDRVRYGTRTLMILSVETWRDQTIRAMAKEIDSPPELPDRVVYDVVGNHVLRWPWRAADADVTLYSPGEGASIAVRYGTAVYRLNEPGYASHYVKGIPSGGEIAVSISGAGATVSIVPAYG